MLNQIPSAVQSRIVHDDDVIEKIAVHKTTNYDKFQIVVGNRHIDDSHVARLTRAIAQRNLLAVNPVMVNEDLCVIDGQHRLYAAKALGVPIYYVIVENAGIAEVQMLNTNTRAWSGYDYLESFAVLGKERYQVLQAFLKQYDLTIAAAFVLLKSRSDGGIYRKFRQGEYAFTDEQLERAEYYAGLLEELAPFFKQNPGRRVPLMQAIVTLGDSDYARECLTKLPRCGLILQPQLTKRDYLRQFEDVLNWNRKTELIRLY